MVSVLPMTWKHAGGRMFRMKIFTGRTILIGSSVNLSGPDLITWGNQRLMTSIGHRVVHTSESVIWQGFQKIATIYIVADGIPKNLLCIFFLTGTGKAVKEKLPRFLFTQVTIVQSCL